MFDRAAWLSRGVLAGSALPLLKRALIVNPHSSKCCTHVASTIGQRVTGGAVPDWTLCQAAYSAPWSYQDCEPVLRKYTRVHTCYTNHTLLSLTHTHTSLIHSSPKPGPRWHGATLMVNKHPLALLQLKHVGRSSPAATQAAKKQKRQQEDDGEAGACVHTKKKILSDRQVDGCL